jgi:peptide/nickel transport system permease protein
VHAIFLEAGLSIVGLGIQPPQPSLGSLLNTGMRYINQSPTGVIGPILILLLLAFAFSLLTDALNETVNRK